MTRFARLLVLMATWVSMSGVSLAEVKVESLRVLLDTATRERCVDILREGLRGSEFWPSIHAAEGLTLGGHGQEVIEFLTPQLTTDSDLQHLCGISREIARAGDRSNVTVMLDILEGTNPTGHVHAAESLFKVYEIGTGPAMPRFLAQNQNLNLKLMTAAALARHGDQAALNVLREMIGHKDPVIMANVAWVMGQIGDQSDIPRLKAQLRLCPDAGTRANHEHALALLGDADGLQALLRNLSSPEDSVRTYAATFASDARAVAAADRLKEMLDDPFADARYRAAQSLLVLAGPAILPYQPHADVVIQELSPKFCWFHPRVAPLPGYGKDGQPAVILTIQKHLAADDHYSGMYFLRTDDLGQTWTGPTEIPELAWQSGDNNETIAVCDVTPGWVSHSKKLLAIGTKLRYSPQGHQLLDKPKSHECAYATYDPEKQTWTTWKMLAMPETDGKNFLVAPGCVQWLEQDDGTLLVPVYVRGPSGSIYTATVLHCSFDGTEMKYLSHGDEITVPDGRGLAEPSLAKYAGRYYLTLRADDTAYITTSDDGLHYQPIRKWTFDDGQDLGSYNTQAHWLSHSDGLFLSYTRRGANNDHIARNRAPIFVAQVDPSTLQVMRSTERALLPERGVMLGNFGAAAITSGESWVTDSEYIEGGKKHPKGADGTTWLGRVKWSKPNQLVK